MNLEIFRGILIPFLGTTLGAACVFFMKRSLSSSIQRALTGFAAGIMTAASVWSLLIPAMEQCASMGKLAFLPAAVGFLVGIFFLLGLDHLIPHLHMNSSEAEGPKSKLKKTTMLVLAVTLHNIPEGMAVAVPLAAGGASRGRAVLTTAAAGAPTVLGAVLGFCLGTMGPGLQMLTLGGASGAMLYVVFGELLPESFRLCRSPAPVMAAVLGVLTGMGVVLG